ncbi:MAG: MOP flippase family protein [Rhodocyclaceae bacterium]|nr:MOP flippase family protein [Rhodocyclaceae bacterium]
MSVARSIAWALMSQMGRQLAVFVTTIFLARLLEPEDFGLLGMATVFTGLVTLLNDVGVSGALVQRQDIEARHLSSMFWLNQIVGLALCLLTVALAPAIAAFFDTSALTPVLQVLSLLFVAGALGIVQQCRLVRAMDFRRLALIESAAVLLAGVAAVIAASAGLGVWSLVLQLLLVPSLTTLGLWLGSDWRPTRCFDRAALAELVPFGLHVAGFNGVNYLARNLDYLFVGRFLGAAALGYYTLAYRLMVYPLQSVSTSVSRVLFPAFSRAAGDPEALRRGYLKMTKGVSLVTFPMIFGIFAVAPEFIGVVYGEKWLPTAELLRILCVAGLVQSIGSTAGAMYQAVNRPDIQLRMALLNTTLTAIVLGVGVQFGLRGVAMAYAGFAFVWVHGSLYVLTRVIDLDYGQMYRRFAPALLASGVMLLGLLALKQHWPLGQAALLATLIPVGALLYAAVLAVLGELRWSGRRPRFRL